MNFKKTIAKSLVVAMALGMVPVANLQTAKAAVTGVEFSGETGIATVKGDGKYWGIAKEDRKGGKGSVKIGDKYYKITNVKEYAGEIDAYAALRGKAGIIAGGEKEIPDESWKVLELPAAESTFKVYVVASTSAVKGVKPTKYKGGEYGYVFATIGKTPKEVDMFTAGASGEAIQVKLNEGEWKTVKDFFGADDAAVTKKLKALAQNGSSLSFRVKGTATTWASKESKVKVAAQPKAPNVKVDITKESTSIKTGMEYQVVAPGAAAGTTWTASAEKKGLSIDALNLAGASKDVLVRTVASGKKLASAVTRVKINKGVSAVGSPTGNQYTATGATIANVARVETNIAYDITKGASLFNLGPEDLEWTLVGANGKVKWSVLKASKDPEKKPSKVALKYSATAKDNTWGAGEVKLYLRRSGVKQDKNGVATLSGVSAGAIMKLSNVTQTLTFTGATGEPTGDITHTGTATTVAISVATGTAAKFVVKGKVTNVVGTKAVAPKLKKVTDLPKGITLKAGKVDPKTGEFEIVINVGKLKDAVTPVTAEFGLEFQGVKSGFKIEVKKK